MEYSGAGGKLIQEKNQKQKISWHCPFKSMKNAQTVGSDENLNLLVWVDFVNFMLKKSGRYINFKIVKL